MRPGRWRSFEEAREFARSLNLKSRREWREFCKSKRKPADLPYTPDRVYAGAGWSGYPDFLGSGWGEWMPFEEAREFARSLGLASVGEWWTYASSDERPADIPSDPPRAYGLLWRGFPDFLGASAFGKEFRSFEGARAFARSLGLKSHQEWLAFSKTDGRPKDVPADPPKIYTDMWTGWKDFLGNRRKSSWNFRPFGAVRRYAHSLGIENGVRWQEFVGSGGAPDGVPANPNAVYADSGWAGWNDFLGHGNTPWRDFGSARRFARSLGLRSAAEWREYAGTGELPHDIPDYPPRAYGDEWTGWIDFLREGTNTGMPTREDEGLTG